jgi:antitoxin MazE
MRTTLRKLGNSAGLIIPKLMLAELGLSTGDAVDCVLEEGRLVLTPLKPAPRTGWATASRTIAEAGDDAPVWPEFANADDDALRW